HAYRFEPPPAANADPFARLAWAAKATVAACLPDASKKTREGIAAVLLSVPREKLPAESRPLHDALLTDALVQVDRLADLRPPLGSVPADQRTPDLKRWLETVRVASLHRALDR